MHELMELMGSLEKVKSSKKTLMCWVEDEIAKGRYGECCCDVEALGEVVDMVKDLAETEEKCMKAKYYETVIEAMKEAENEPSERYGYDNWRYKSGRYAPKGHGHRSGYSPDLMMYEGYDGTMHTGAYDDDMYRRMNPTGKMGYPMKGGLMTPRGKAYDEYEMARRHYTETKSEADRREMNDKIDEHVHEMIGSFREMWKDADPEMKKQMKMDFKNMLEDFEHMA